jgi:hypothetical protein
VACRQTSSARSWPAKRSARGRADTALHDRGYSIRRLPDRWEIRRPDGTLIDSTGRPLTGHVESLIEMDTRAGTFSRYAVRAAPLASITAIDVTISPPLR